MKTNKIMLASWPHEPGENIEINWPKVQKEIGIDHLKWLLDQSKNKCQLCIEKTLNEKTNQEDCSLIAEFYDSQLLTVYHLMWAK